MTGMRAGFYSYLNLESTKTARRLVRTESTFYSYLNLESTKTDSAVALHKS